MSNTIDFEQQDKEYIANTYGRFNVCFEKGKGSLLWDVNGKEYIDLGSGIGVTAFGVDDDDRGGNKAISCVEPYLQFVLFFTTN